MSAWDGQLDEERWPAMMAEPRRAPETLMDPTRLGAVWRSEIGDEYGEAAIQGTLAIALRALGEAASVANAEARAKALWLARDRSLLAAA